MLLEHRDVDDARTDAQHRRERATNGASNPQREVMNLTRLPVFLVCIREGTAPFVVGFHQGPNQHHDGQEFEDAVQPVAKCVNDANTDERTDQCTVQG